MFSGSGPARQELIEALTEYYKANQSWQGVDRLLGQAGRGMHGNSNMMARWEERLRLLDDKGEILFDSENLVTGEQITQDELFVSVPIIINNQTVGYLLPERNKIFTQSDEEFLIKRIKHAAIISGLITAVISLVMLSFLTYRLLKPVHELTRATEHIAQGDLSQRVPVRGNDELAALGRAFNRMADSLENAEKNRRIMTADIAHELRNPLAVQRANLEAMQDGIYELSPENIKPIIEQNLLLTRLVEDLRTLAQADTGKLELIRVESDFSALVKKNLERFQSQADQKHISMQLSGGESCPVVFLDPQRIEQILGNILSNALRYTPPSGKIDLSISCSPENVKLEIHDGGPGIPEEALPHMFQRFYRPDRARSRSEGGSGLGLAIARKIAEAHGGTLSIANHPQGGALVTLTLPISGKTS